MNDQENSQRRYIGQVHTTFESHPELVDKNTIVSGDFNWNRMWDESPNSPLCGDFSDVRDALNKSGFCSSYHAARGDEFGKESEATFYMHKKAERPCHIDCVFAPRRLLGMDFAVTIGGYDD